MAGDEAKVARNNSQRQGRSRFSQQKRSRSDAHMLKCKKVTQIEVHPAYKFTDAKWGILPKTVKNKIIQERN